MYRNIQTNQPATQQDVKAGMYGQQGGQRQPVGGSGMYGAGGIGQKIMQKYIEANPPPPPPPPPVFDLAKSGNPNAATSESLANMPLGAVSGQSVPIGELMFSTALNGQRPEGQQQIGMTSAMPVSGVFPVQGPIQNVNSIQNPVTSLPIKGSSKVVS